jgi:hypothetical protein
MTSTRSDGELGDDKNGGKSLPDHRKNALSTLVSDSAVVFATATTEESHDVRSSCCQAQGRRATDFLVRLRNTHLRINRVQVDLHAIFRSGGRTGELDSITHARI